MTATRTFGAALRASLLTVTTVLVLVVSAVGAPFASAAGTPGQLTGVSARPGPRSGELTVSWLPPAGGATVQGYHVYRYAMGSSSRVAELPATARSLTDNGHFGLQLFDATGGVIDDEGEGPRGIIVNTIGVLTANVEQASVARPASGSSTIDIPVQLSARPSASAPATVDVGTQDYTAQAGTDYVATSRTLSFTHDSPLVQYVPVTILPAGTGTTKFTLAITNFSKDVRPGAFFAYGFITPFSTPLRPDVEADNVTVPHRTTAGTASFRVYLNHPARVATSVHYATSDGSQDPNAPSGAAQAGTDYTATSGTVNFPAGATTATVAVPVLPLAAHGANNAFMLSLSDPNGVSLTNPAASATLVNTAGVEHATYSLPYTVQSRTGTKTTTFEALLYEPTLPADDITLRYSTADGQAKAGTDYVSASGLLTFAAGDTSKPFSVQVLPSTTSHTARYFVTELDVQQGAVSPINLPGFPEIYGP